MGELIGALFEAVAGLFAAIVEAIPLIIESLFYIVSASLVVIAYCVSPVFRRKKRNEWAKRPVKKYLDLGISTMCLCTLAGLVTWLVFLSQPHRPAPDIIQFADGTAGTGAQLQLAVVSAQGTTNKFGVSVKQGGVKKIIETTSLHELKKAVQENVTVSRGKDKLQPVNAETNRPAAATDSP